MSTALPATRDLLRFAELETDVETLRSMFLRCYDELETQNAPLKTIVGAAFDGLDSQKDRIALFCRMATEIARRVDNGDDGTCEHAYHNAAHFAKVVINFRALAGIHNLLHPDEALSNEEIAVGLLAATAHDIGHNGRGNTVEGQHKQFRLEQLAIDTAISWVQSEDADRDLILEALSPIYATDVSSDGTNISPARFVRELHDVHGGNDSLPATPYSEALKLFFNTRGKVLVASILHDADVFSSLIEEEAHLRENSRLGAEFEKATGNPPSATSSLWFLGTMLQGRSTTETARRFSDSFIASQLAKLQSA